MKHRLFKSWGPAATQRAGTWTLTGTTLLLVFLLLPSANLRGQSTPNGVFVDTLSGGGLPPFYGHVDGNTANLATFHTPIGLAMDTTGDYLFVADRDNHAVRMLDLVAGQTYTFVPISGLTPSGAITNPVGVAVDLDDNLYVLNRGNGRNGTVVEFDYYGDFVRTVAQSLTNANAFTMDSADNLYVTVNTNTVIRITPGGVKTTIATVTNASASLQGIAMLDSGQLAVCDVGRHGIYLINPVSGVITTNTGFNGPGDYTGVNNRGAIKTTARFYQPYGLAKAGDGMLVVTDYGNHRVKVVNAVGTVTNLYGVSSNLWCANCNPHCTNSWPGWYDGPVTIPDACGDVEARLPNGVAVAQDGSVYVTEDYYHLIRHATGAGLVGPGPLPQPPLFRSVLGIALDAPGVQLYIADLTNNAVQVLHLGNNQTETFLDFTDGLLKPVDVMLDSGNNIYVLNQGTGANGSLLQFDQFGNLLVTLAAGLAWPTAITLDNSGNIYVTEQSGAVRQFSSGSSNTVATITNAGVQLQGIALFDDGTLAVSDAGNHVVWQVNPVTHAVTLLTGTPGVPGTTLGPASFAKLNQPYRLTRAVGSLLIAADRGNNRLVVVNRAGAITNVLNSTNASIWYGQSDDPQTSTVTQPIPMLSPFGVALGNDGGVYASEVVNKDIRKIPGTGLSRPPLPSPPQSPMLRTPMGIALDTTGAQLFIADLASNAVQVLHLGNNQTETFLSASAGILQPVDVAVDATNNLYVLNQGTGGNGSVLAFDQFGNLLQTNASGLALPTALAVDGFGNVFVAEKAGAVQQFSAGGSNTLFTITNAGVQLQGIALFSDGTFALSDAGNHVIWQVNPVTHAVTLLTGTPGVPGATLGSAGLAKLNQPYHLARAAGNLLVAADYGNNRLVVVNRAGAITNVLNSTNASVWYGRSDDPQTSSGAQPIPMVSPVGVALASDGGVYASEVTNKDIRKITGTGLAPAPAFYFPSPVFNNPRGLALNTVGGLLYIADQTNNAIQALNLANNITTIFLDTTDGISRPVDVAVDSSDNLYVLSQGTPGSGSILKFDHFGNLLTNIATGLALPTAFKLDGYGSLFVAEQGGTVQQFSGVTSNHLTTITNAGVRLQGIAMFDDGTIVVSDAGNHVLWQINPVTKAVTLLTGVAGSPGTTLGAVGYAQLNQPQQLARAAGNLLVAADAGNNRLVVINRSGAVTNVLNSTNALVWYGQPGDPHGNSDALFPPMVTPGGVVLNSAGEVFTSEAMYNDVRKLLTTGLANTTPPYFPSPVFNGPKGLALNTVGSLLYIADQTNNAIQALNLANNITADFLSLSNGISRPVDVAVDFGDFLYVLNQGTAGNGSIMKFDHFGNPLGTIATNLAMPTAFKNAYGGFFVAEQGGAIQQFISGTSNTIVTITNAGVQLQGIALFNDGTIVVSDSGNHVIWQVNPATKVYTLFTGAIGVPGTTLGATNFARLNQPRQLARTVGDLLVAADAGNNRLVVIDRSGAITNVLNSTNALVWYGRTGDPHASSDAQFPPMLSPVGVLLNNAGEVFASEDSYSDIRKLLNTGLSGPPPAYFPPSLFNGPRGLALNTVGGMLYVADQANNAIRALNLISSLTTTFLRATNGISQPVDVAVDASDNLYVLSQGTTGDGSIVEFDHFANMLGVIVTNLAKPTTFKRDAFGCFLVAEQDGAIQRFNGGASNLVAVITNAGVQLQGIATFDDGTIAVSDAGNHVIWQVNPTNSTYTLFSGAVGVPGSTLGATNFGRLNQPHQLARAVGDLLVAVDSGNNRLVVIDRSGSITNVLNSTNALVWYGQTGDPHSSIDPQFAPMSMPIGIVLDSAGNAFASEAFYDDIRELLSTGLTAPPLPIPTPSAPTIYTVLTNYGQVFLGWSAQAGATSYNLKRSPANGGPYTTIANTSATNYTDTTVLNGTTYYYVVSAIGAGGEGPNSAQVSARPPLPPVPDPIIGFVSFPPPLFTSVLHPVSSFVLNNDAPIVIQGDAGSQTFYTYGPTPTSGSIPDPNSASASAPVGYEDGLYPSQVAYYTIAQVLPDLTIRAIGEKPDGSPNSAIVEARFQFITANPLIGGNNAASFAVSDITANAQMWYTVDGSDPTNASPSVGPIASGTTLSLQFPPGASNLTFKVIAVRTNYQASAIVPALFSATNFVPNSISFGFASGEASSDFIGAAGQIFWAPVTLSPLPNTKIYSLQFNLTVTNAGLNPGPAVTPGAYLFQSMLKKPVPDSPGDFITIPPAMFLTSATNLQPVVPPTNQVFQYNNGWFEPLIFSDNSLNLLGVGWLERYNKTNLYDTTAQTLIDYSMAHDTLFTPTIGKVVVGGYAFQIPTDATAAQTYRIQIGRPSATSDGIGAPGSDVYIAAPTNGSLVAGPINSIKVVTVGQRKYLAGDCAPFRWLNAGDFGNTNLNSSDVEQAFQSAIYGINFPTWGSDFFDSMDSCGCLGVLTPNGYYIRGSTITDPATLNLLFDGNDTTINQIPFGDGSLDVCDVYVTFRRSLDPSLTWWQRFWTNGVLAAETIAQPKDAATTPKLKASVAFLTNPPSVNFAAADIMTSAGQTVSIPISAKIFGDYALRLLMLSLSVEPLDGSPALTSAIQFTPNAALGNPSMTASKGNGLYSATWLNNAIGGLTGNATLGTLRVTIPANAPSSAAYAMHFDHASASPNGLAPFPKQTLTSLILLSDQSSSIYNDGLPDSWRLRYFGTVHNILAQAAADADGDGTSNWHEYMAGTDPTDPKSFLRASTDRSTAQGIQDCVIRWPSVSAKRYLIERSTSPFNPSWIPVCTNTGNGRDMEFHDMTGGQMRFYRVRVTP